MSDSVDNDLGSFEFVTDSDFEEDFFSQLDGQGQPLPEPTPAASSSNNANAHAVVPAPVESSMSLDSNNSELRLGSESAMDLTHNNSTSAPPIIAPGSDNYNANSAYPHVALFQNEPSVEVSPDLIQNVLDRLSSEGNNSPGVVPQQFFEEDHDQFRTSSQDSHSGMNIDSPAGSQQFNLSLPVQYPASQGSSQSSQDSLSDEPGLGSLSQEHNQTVPQFTRDQLELPSSQESI